MNIAGFTFIRNAVRLDYPVREAILSILPLCNKVYVAVGNSDDTTRDLIASIDPEKIVIIDTIWDDTLREGGRVLAVETDKAYAAIEGEVDWTIYIQGDEVLPESSLPILQDYMQRYKDRKDVDGLLLKYRHFYGSYDYIGAGSGWYENEIRVLRKSDSIYSYKDAQGFRKNENEKLSVIDTPAYMHHYGWVREPAAMQRKQESFHKLWHNDAWMEKHIAKAEEFDYSGIHALYRFEGQHPECMKERIERMNWTFDFDISYNRFPCKELWKQRLRRYLNLDFRYKNYRIIR